MLSVNTATKYIHLTGLRSLIEEIDGPGSGTVSVPLGEPVTITVSKVQDKYAFLSTADGQESYMGVSLTFLDMPSFSFLGHQVVVLSSNESHPMLVTSMNCWLECNFTALH